MRISRYLRELIAKYIFSVQIGWITLDNASNNDTFVAALERILRGRHIRFDKVERRVRYAIDIC